MIFFHVRKKYHTHYHVSVKTDINEITIRYYYCYSQCCIIYHIVLQAASGAQFTDFRVDLFLLVNCGQANQFPEHEHGHSRRRIPDYGIFHGIHILSIHLHYELPGSANPGRDVDLPHCEIIYKRIYYRIVDATQIRTHF